MGLQAKRRDSKTLVVSDEDSESPTTFVEDHSACADDTSGPLAQTDTSELLLMSEYDSNKAQNYGVYEYEQGTRPQQSDDYASFGPHPSYEPGQQLPTGLPSPADFAHLTSTPQFSPYDPAFYAQANVPAYLASASRPLPDVISYTPNHGQQSTKVTLYFRSAYDLNDPPVKAVLMFGQMRCPSMLQKTAQDGQMFQYALSADTPPFTATRSLSPQVPLQLAFDDSPVAWDSPSLQFGQFTYIDQPPVYPPSQTVQSGSKKRKLSTDASPRRSPVKKQSMQHLGGPKSLQTGDLTASYKGLRHSSASDLYAQPRRVSGIEYQQHRDPNIANVRSQAYYGPQVGQTPPSAPPTQSPAWSYFPNNPSTTVSPSVGGASGSSKTPQMLQSPATVPNPPLIRTSTLQQGMSAAVPVVTHAEPGFANFPVYGAKAELKIEGDLDGMTKGWTDDEWTAGRRIVQFQRSQAGSFITTTFAPVTLADRIPNGICVSCIFWEEKQECYVTSVDTISLLEALVGVRFTVEEKNRIRRNLEGYHPTTVSKTKQDCEAFFKLIMNFPNPKPRNIEKDVKVFPWRILARALVKIIGKYSATYASTAGALPAAAAATLHPSAAAPRYTAAVSDTGFENASRHLHRSGTSPQSTTSGSEGSHGHAYTTVAMAPAHAYSPHDMGISPGLGIGGGPPTSVVTLTVPDPTAPLHQQVSWQQLPPQYATDLSRGSWAFAPEYLNSNMANAAAAPRMEYVPRLGMPVELGPVGRFVPAHDYRGQSHPTSSTS